MFRLLIYYSSPVEDQVETLNDLHSISICFHSMVGVHRFRVYNLIYLVHLIIFSELFLVLDFKFRYYSVFKQNYFQSTSKLSVIMEEMSLGNVSNFFKFKTFLVSETSILSCRSPSNNAYITDTVTVTVISTFISY